MSESAIGRDGFPNSGWAPPDDAFPAKPFAALAEAARIAPAPKPSQGAASSAAPSAAPTVEFLTDRPRTRTITLQWPVKVSGVPYREIVLRRLTMGEVSAFSERVRVAGESADVRFPIFYTVDGHLLPDEVWNALDTDDSDVLLEAASAFLPARWRGVPAQSALDQPAGDSTGSSSQA